MISEKWSSLLSKPIVYIKFLVANKQILFMYHCLTLQYIKRFGGCCLLRTKGWNAAGVDIFSCLTWSNCNDLCEWITATTFCLHMINTQLSLSISLPPSEGKLLPPVSQKHGPLKCSTYNTRKLLHNSSTVFALNHSHPCGLNVNVCIDKLLCHNKNHRILTFS